MEGSFEIFRGKKRTPGRQVLVGERNILSAGKREAHRKNQTQKALTFSFNTSNQHGHELYQE
jgi:hypothetical protein